MDEKGFLGSNLKSVAVSFYPKKCRDQPRLARNQFQANHCLPDGAKAWRRTPRVRGNTPAITSATTRTANPDLNECVRAA
jgi:hypothetical protein